MKRYKIIVGRREERMVAASRLSVAVQRALDGFKESSFGGYVEISIRDMGTVKFNWRVSAQVACEPEGSFKRQILPDLPAFARKREAEAECDKIWQKITAKEITNMKFPVVEREVRP